MGAAWDPVAPAHAHEGCHLPRTPRYAVLTLTIEIFLQLLLSKTNRRGARCQEFGDSETTRRRARGAICGAICGAAAFAARLLPRANSGASRTGRQRCPTRSKKLDASARAPRKARFPATRGVASRDPSLRNEWGRAWADSSAWV